MNLQKANVIGMSPLQNFVSSDFVSSDFDALESHMRRCAQSRDGLESIRVVLELFHSVAAARIVTTAAVLGACALVLLSIA
jgi:hypothetical protein